MKEAIISETEIRNISASPEERVVARYAPIRRTTSDAVGLERTLEPALIIQDFGPFD